MNKWKKIHPNFQLNNQTFVDKSELQRFVIQQFSSVFTSFVNDWFTENETVVVQTSGSTGKPKSISLRKDHILNSINSTATYFQLFENTKALLCLPIEYIAGKLMLLRAIHLGWQLDVVEPNSNPLQDSKKTYDFVAMVPLQVQNSLDNLHLIDTLLIGGAAINPTLENQLKGLKTKVFLSYGMTETCTHIALKKINHIVIKPQFFEVLPDVKIYADSNNCLVIDAPKVSENILFTNDIVQLISNNQFEVLGRFDNVINSGGIKIHPEIVEKKLSKIIDCRFFIASLPDENLGEKVILVIESEAFTIDFDNLNLAFFEKPKHIYFIPKFIETNTGKVQRAETLKLVIE